MCWSRTRYLSSGIASNRETSRERLENPREKKYLCFELMNERHVLDSNGFFLFMAKQVLGPLNRLATVSLFHSVCFHFRSSMQARISGSSSMRSSTPMCTRKSSKARKKMTCCTGETSPTKRTSSTTRNGTCCRRSLMRSTQEQPIMSITFEAIT